MKLLQQYASWLYVDTLILLLSVDSSGLSNVDSSTCAVPRNYISCAYDYH